MAGNPASVSSDFLFSSRDSQLAQDMSNQKQTGVLPGKGPLSRASLRPQLFREFYLQPVYRPASTRFQQVLFFAAHFHGRCFALPFTRLCEPTSSDATIEGSINSEPCA